MNRINVEINKADVYDEVAKTTAYIGGKTLNNDGSNLYDQVFVTDADKDMLERFWHGATDALQTVIDSVLQSTSIDTNGNCNISLAMTDNYPMQLEGAVKSTIIDYVANTIIGEWLNVTNKAETESYQKQAAALLMQVNNLIHKRMRPTRTF